LGRPSERHKTARIPYTTVVMHPEITIRAAVISDIDPLLHLMRGLQQDDPWSVPFRENDVRESLRELLGNPSSGRVFSIHESDSCVGYLVLSFDFSLEYRGKNAWVDELFIQPEFRGRGIGSKTLDFAAEAARDCGAKVLHLEVNRENPAIDLYRRHGLEDHNRYLLSKWLTRKNEEAP
jgi:ribosomal protein S18 acetylase RimI-like enzyme